MTLSDRVERAEGGEDLVARIAEMMKRSLALTPEQRAEMWKARRESWARGLPTLQTKEEAMTVAKLLEELGLWKSAGENPRYSPESRKVAAWEFGKLCWVNRAEIIAAVKGRDRLLEALPEALVNKVITEQGGSANPCVTAGDKFVALYCNGYDAPTDKQRAEAEAFAKGWNAARAALSMGFGR